MNDTPLTCGIDDVTPTLERLVLLFGDERVRGKLGDVCSSLAGANLPQLEGMDDEELKRRFNETLYPKDENNLFVKYVMPPFSTLDSRSGPWQKRKREWVELLGKIGETEEGLLAEGLMAKVNGGTSFFDPVLAELIVTWFSRPQWNVFNPFCGEATVAALTSALNRSFLGIDIRQEQVDKNTATLAANGYGNARFLCGDSIDCDGLIESAGIEPSFDLIFSSPPYYDLEIYSDSEGDISQMGTYEEFITGYQEIFRKAVAMLKDNRFLVVKVSEVRDKKTGAYYNFVGDNIRIFQELGLHYYNEIILINSVGTAPMRAGGTFSTRKVVRLHQNVLVFYKGDPRKVTDEFFDDPAVYAMPVAEQGSLFAKAI